MTSVKNQPYLENEQDLKDRKFTKEKSNGLSKDSSPYIPESMSISIASVSSSLTSPGDSGVQLLDSESEIASIMSMSGQDFTFSDNYYDKYEAKKPSPENTCVGEEIVSPTNDARNSVILNTDFQIDQKLCDLRFQKTKPQNIVSTEIKPKLSSNELHLPISTNLMTTSDIANQNTTPPMYDYKIYSHSAPSESRQSYNTSPIAVEETETEVEVKQTAVNGTDSSKMSVVDKDDVMQTSVIAPMVDEQIVYRRQRRKKLKSQDTPKKRVSFHEDILNSTKIDDIHIDRGFVTRQPGINMHYYNEDLLRKRGVVVGRYSWAAEGDSPYYQSTVCEREVKSDIIYGSSNNRVYGSNSSSSSISLDSTNSSDSSGDSPHEEYYPGIINGIKNIKKVPKSSCLKKPKHGRNYIDTKIVQEESPHSSRRNLTRKISESNILDTNIFGSLKNIYKTLSSSVPLAERGVPEGQEDFTTFSSTENLNRSKRNSYSSTETLLSKSYDNGKSSSLNVQMVCESEVDVVHPVQMYKKPNLRLSRSEGFYPNYPTMNHSQQENIILCDSNVYEHRGISYSYEYDQFQSTFNKESNKSKSSTVYQMLLNEISFLKKSQRQNIPEKKNEIKKNTVPNNNENHSPKHSSTPVKKLETNSNKKTSTTPSEWSSDTESISDISEKTYSRHLQSPSRKRNLKPNHYSVQHTNLKCSEQDSNPSSDNFSDIASTVSMSSEKINTVALKPTTSKTSLINRFLRNVTQRKILDAKLHNNDNNGIGTEKNNYLSFYLKNVKPNEQLVENLNTQIKQEIENNQQNKAALKINELNKFKKKINNQLFRDENETLLDVFKIKTAYNKKGESRAMLTLLTNTTLYISTLNRNQIFYNEFIIPYTELHFILIGPNRQSIYISNISKSLRYMIMTGNAETTSEIVGKIEFAMRNDCNKPQLPAIKELMMRDMYQLRGAIYKQTPVTEDEDFYHYSLVNLQEDQLSPSSTPLGPFREGFLMYRKAQTEHRWQFGYFILKGGVLYTLTSPSCRIPVKVIPLQGGACQGAHRTPPRPRPHTFELLTESECLEFAASDEYEASDWLQALVQSASGMQVTDDIPQTTCCSLVLTTDHLVTVRECFDLGNKSPVLEDSVTALSYAAISDLTSFKVPLAAQSWCVLEFACREVHETSGDWILYFSSNTELDKFLSVLEVLWSYSNSQGDSFPLTTVPETELLNRQASETYCILQQSWVAFQ